jgi:hypothetical protein
VIEDGEENDVLTGGGGDDRIVGDRDGDTMSGGDGDDTLVWNNGDGSDVMDGARGRDTIEINGAPTAGDALTAAPAGARIDFDRTNLVPFSLDIGTSKRSRSTASAATTRSRSATSVPPRAPPRAAPATTRSTVPEAPRRCSAAAATTPSPQAAAATSPLATTATTASPCATASKDCLPIRGDPRRDPRRVGAGGRDAATARRRGRCARSWRSISDRAEPAPGVVAQAPSSGGRGWLKLGGS